VWRGQGGARCREGCGEGTGRGVERGVWRGCGEGCGERVQGEGAAMRGEGAWRKAYFSVYLIIICVI
jgi:hypothetical protein